MITNKIKGSKSIKKTILRHMVIIDWIMTIIIQKVMKVLIKIDLISMEMISILEREQLVRDKLHKHKAIQVLYIRVNTL